MHELPVEWKQGSWLYTQVWREGNLAIYRQKHQEGNAERFEIIRVQHREDKLFPGGKVQEAGEYYPGSSQWGQEGWTCFTLEEAHAHARAVAARGGADGAREEDS